MTSAQGTPEARIAKALEIAAESGWIDGAHHKMWVIDQMVRALTDCPIIFARNHVGKRYETQGESDEYQRFLAKYDAWDTGIAP